MMARRSGASVSVFERLGLVFAFILGAILAVFSFLSAVVDFTKWNVRGVLIDIVFLCIGVMICVFCVKTYRRTLYYEKLADRAFEEGIYRRLEPLLRKFAEMRIEIEDIESRLNGIDKKVDTVIEENLSRNPQFTAEHILPGTTVSFAIKAIFAAIITIGGFLFMLETCIITGIEECFPLVMLFFYILWWLLITQEFSLYEEKTLTSALSALFIPILTVPVGFILMEILMYALIVYLNDVGILHTPGNEGYISSIITISIFYILLAVYATAYYAHAVHIRHGISPATLFRKMFLKR